MLRLAAQLCFQALALHVLRHQPRQHADQIHDQRVAFEALRGEEEQDGQHLALVHDRGEQGGLQAQLLHLVAGIELGAVAVLAVQPQQGALAKHHGFGRVRQQQHLLAQRRQHLLDGRGAAFLLDGDPRAFRDRAHVQATRPVQRPADQGDHLAHHDRFVLSLCVELLQQLDDVGLQAQQQVLVVLARHVAAHAPVVQQLPGLLVDDRAPRQRQREQATLGEDAELEVTDAFTPLQGGMQQLPAGMRVLQEHLARLLQVLRQDSRVLLRCLVVPTSGGGIAVGRTCVIGQLLGQLRLAGPGNVHRRQVPEIVTRDGIGPVTQQVRNLLRDLADPEVRLQLPVPVGTQLGQGQVLGLLVGQLVGGGLALGDVLGHAGDACQLAVLTQLGRAHPAHPDGGGAVLHVPEHQVDAFLPGTLATVLALELFLVLGVHADEEGLLRDRTVLLFQTEHVVAAAAHVDHLRLLIPHPRAHVCQPFGQTVLGLQFLQPAVHGPFGPQVLGRVQQAVGKHREREQRHRCQVHHVGAHPFRVQLAPQNDQQRHGAGQDEHEQPPAQAAQVFIESLQCRCCHVNGLRPGGPAPVPAVGWPRRGQPGFPESC